MGNEESVSSRQKIRPYDTFTYAPVSIQHGLSNNKYKTGLELFDNQNASLLNTAYHGVWSLSFPNTLCPSSRMGQCHIYDHEKDRLIIAYGIDSQGNCLNDVWALNLLTLNWDCLNHNALSPRQYSSAVLYGRKMIIFGGVFNHNFLSDLHFIDIDSGQVTLINSNGTIPSPRTSPILFFYPDHSLYLWSGYDGSPRGGIYHFDLETFQWEKFERGHTGRVAPAFCNHKGRYFIFGSSKGHGLIEFFPEKGEFVPIECSGTEPERELTRSSLISVDNYLFLIGGESESNHMHIFVFDVSRNWWFAFHVRPDMINISIKDGIINKVGLFMLPREHSSSIIYRKKERELISVFGSRLMNPPPVFKISIGSALSSLHLRNDMLEMFQYSLK